MDDEKMMYLIVMITNISDVQIPEWDDKSSGIEWFMEAGNLSEAEWEKWMDGQTYEPVAIYGDLEDASYWLEQLIDQIKGTADEGRTSFDIIGMELDQDPPQLLIDLKHEEEILKSTVQEILVKLMKEGLVDQLIGEDGKFYYEITDVGREKIKDMPTNIKDYFEDKD